MPFVPRVAFFALDTRPLPLDAPFLALDFRCSTLDAFVFSFTARGGGSCVSMMAPMETFLNVGKGGSLTEEAATEFTGWRLVDFLAGFFITARVLLSYYIKDYSG